MAELLVAGGGTFPGPLGTYLRDGLADDYCVVVEPVVYRCPIDAIVVGPPGLVLVQVVASEPAPSTAGAESQGNGDGVVRSRADGHAASTDASGRARDALARFLRDEFPGLSPRLIYLPARPRPGAPNEWAPLEQTDMAHATLVDAIAAGGEPPDEFLADPDVREALAVALRDRQLSRGQRALQPFVFRSGGPLGNGAKAWTVRDAVRHMDAHPSDGIYHLRNGTLASWLESEGAAHLAGLARAVVRQTRTDQRVVLETFLLGTGLVDRPRLSPRPRSLDLGYVLAGETACGVLHLQQGSGRGYLFGALTTTDPWLDVEPRSFNGAPADVVVRADTAGLLIGAPYHAGICVESSASEEPRTIPVRVRVMAMPAVSSRVLLRPLGLALAGGLLGALLGFVAGRWGVPAPQWLSFLPQAPVAPGLWWALAVGLLWAVLGAVRGALQPLAWPLRYALARWVAWLAAWGVGCAALAVLVTAVWDRADIVNRLPLSSPVRLTIALLAAGLAAIPATFGEVDVARAGTDVAHQPLRRPRLRPMVTRATVVLALAALLLAVPLFRPAWVRFEGGRAATSVSEWATNAWSRLDQSAKDTVDSLYLRYYDRRAP